MEFVGLPVRLLVFLSVFRYFVFSIIFIVKVVAKRKAIYEENKQKNMLWLRLGARKSESIGHEADLLT